MISIQPGTLLIVKKEFVWFTNLDEAMSGLMAVNRPESTEYQKEMARRLKKFTRVVPIGETIVFLGTRNAHTDRETIIVLRAGEILETWAQFVPMDGK